MEDAKDPRIEHIIKMFEHQKSIRSKSDPERWEAFAFLKHRMQSQSVTADCPVKDIKLHDMSAVEAFDAFIDGFMGAFMSPSQNWFKSRLKYKKYVPGRNIDDNYGYQYTYYLDTSIKDEMDHSNHYEEQKMASKDTIAGGYSCMMIQNDPDTDRCFYQTLLPWRCYFDKDLHGNWCEFYYEYTLDGLQLLEKYENIGATHPDLFSKAVKGGRNASFRMLMCIVKRGLARDPEDGYKYRFKKNMKYAFLEICLDTNQILNEGGYDDFPIVIHTWENPGDSQYGSGIGNRFLPEMRKLNRLGYEYGLSIAKINHPPWLVPDTMKNKFSDDPEARNYYTTESLLPKSMQERIDIPDQLQALLQQQQTVKKFFHSEMFDYFLSTDKVYTATQVNQVKADSSSTLAFAFFNIQRQKYDPTIKLTMKIMIDNDRLVIDPKYIGKDAETKIEFVLDSAMAQMLQKYTQVNAATAVIELVQTLISMQMNEPIRNINLDNIVRSYLFSVGSPASFVKSKEDVDKERAAEEQMRANQMALQNQLTQSEINRNNAGAANLNNVQGFNGGMQ